MDRRELLKRSGLAATGFALGATLPMGAASALAAQDANKLLVWDTLNDPSRGGVIEGLAKSFEAAHEGVTVEHRGWETEELGQTLPRAVDSKQGPAVAQVNNGESLAGPMIRAGQLVSLVEYTKKYGWDKKLPEGLIARNRYTADGKTFGEGDLWGVSAEAEIVGFYYNKKVFSDNDLKVPTTFEEFETLMAALRSAGQEPLVFGNLDKWQAIHLFGEIQGTYTTRKYLDDLIYRRGDSSFEDQSMVDAANKVIEWKNNEFFMQGFEGVNGDDATALFAAGTGAILLQGSWAAGDVAAGLKDDAGFFLMPPHEGGNPVLNVGGVGIPYSITTNAPDPDLAAAFIDTLVSEEAFNAFIDAGVLPAGEIPADKIKDGTLTGDLYTNWNAALANDGIGHYLDWAAPGDFYDILTGQLQELLGGKTDAAKFTAALQEAYAASFK